MCHSFSLYKEKRIKRRRKIEPLWKAMASVSGFPGFVQTFSGFGLWMQTWIVMGKTGKAGKVEKNLLQRS
jgi:hypothetical protein